MNTTFRIGSSGLKYHQKNLDVLGNNIANVNTYGFKTERMSFSSQLYTSMQGNPRPAQDAERTGEPLIEGQDIMTGHGVRTASVDTLFEQGAPYSTENPMDYAIMGEGMFGLLTGSGEKRYTRTGNFIISMEGSKPYLKTTQGDYVTDVKGKKIQIPYKTSGEIDHEKLSPSIGIFVFPNKYGLEQAGGNTYVETTQSGKPIPADGKKANRPDILQSFLEGSSVDISKQMVDLILAQKAFQFSAKVVQVGDEVEQIINSLR